MKIKKVIPRKAKNCYHLWRSKFAAVWFGFPARKIKVIGVTGTDGKTTTVQMITKILDEAGLKAAMASSINFKVGRRKWKNETKFTTLSAWKINKFLRMAVKEKCQYAVLEVSSHSLDQHRLWGIDFSVAVITNITREHLDYHKTMKEYRKAKFRLFEKFEDDGVAIVNLEMKNSEDFIKLAKAPTACIYSIEDAKKNYALESGIEKANKTFKLVRAKKRFPENKKIKELVAKEVSFGLEGVNFKINEERFHLNLIGRFNIENALAAIGVGSTLGINLSKMSRALKKIKGIPGRMEYIKNKQGIEIIIDYALTPDAMERLGRLMEQMKNKDQQRQLIWVFGACGDRDRGKRPIMAKTVSKYADYIIVTNEDPYNEDPKKIIEEVYVGVDETKKGKHSWKILDREKAIKKALQIAQEGDIVLVTGKGAEETMAVGRKRIKWNDKKIIKKLLKNKN